MAGSPTSKNLIAVVIGAVLLFGVISMIPIIIMRRHRHRAAERHANELRCLQVNGTMRQVTVQRWLDQQTRSGNLERYAGESCPICLTSLLAPSALSYSRPGSIMHHSHNHDTQHQTQALLPLPPDAAHMSSSSHQSDDDKRTQPPRQQDLSPVQRTRPISAVLILNRCNHAFHTACLASWFKHRQYRCPICADVLFAESDS